MLDWLVRVVLLRVLVLCSPSPITIPICGARAPIWPSRPRDREVQLRWCQQRDGSPNQIHMGLRPSGPADELMAGVYERTGAESVLQDPSSQGSRILLAITPHQQYHDQGFEITQVGKRCLGLGDRSEPYRLHKFNPQLLLPTCGLTCIQFNCHVWAPDTMVTSNHHITITIDQTWEFAFNKGN